MRWNPISDGRRNNLLKWLKNQLRKRNQLENFGWYVAQIDENVSWVDPTRSGNYARWVLGLLITGDLNSTEDYEKTHELLKEFDRIKSRLPSEKRNIYQYHSFSELYRVVREYLPKTLSRKELVAKGQKVIHKDALFEIIHLTTVEAVVAASKNSGWCTCNARAAQNYLEQGNLFLVYRDRERLLLAHEGSRQVMLEDNSPYTEYEPHLMELFKIYIPSLYCPKHPHGELRNKLCATECGAAGCCGDFIKCGSCSNLICDGCVKKCITCEVGHCEDCIVEECHYADCKDGHLCGSCLEECYRCEAPMCASHQEECNICGNKFCTDCSEYCNSCNNRVCKEHWFECAGCQAEECGSCAEGSTAICPICESIYCEGCMQRCSGCDRIICFSCIDDTCSECEGEDEDEDDWDEDD